jgi:hypothetical protein
MQTVVVMLAVSLVLAFINGRFASSAQMEARHIRPAQFGDHVFRQQRWLLVFCLCILVTSGSGMVALAILRPIGWWFFVLLIGVIFFATSLLGILDYALASVEIRGSEVLYRRLFRRKPFPLSAIDKSVVRGGYIVIHLGKRRVRLIPLTFRDSGLLLAMLRDYRPFLKGPNQALQPTPARPVSLL